MKTVLAIFRKDIRRLWPYALLLVVVLAIVSGFNLPPPIRLIAAPACWLIIVTAIHQERLTGDRQYWVTRPITWKHVLASKILLVLVFVNLPVLLYHVTAWIVVGIPPHQHLSALLRIEALLTAWYILPAAALAAVTANFGQTVFAALLACATWAALAFGFRYSVEWAYMQWSRMTAPAIFFTFASSLVLLMQYSRRRTWLARFVIVLALAVLVLVSSSASVARVFARPLRSSVHMTLDDSRRPGLSLANWQWVGVQIPVRIDGLPADTELFVAGVAATASGPGIGPHTLYRAALADDWLQLDFRPEADEAVANGQLDVQGVADLVAFRPAGSVPAPQDGRAAVPRAGSCSTELVRSEYRIVCFIPPARAALYAEWPQGGANWIVPYGFGAAPLSATEVFQPLEKHSSQLSYADRPALADIRLVAAEPVGHYEVNFHFQDLHFRRPKLGEWR